MSFIVIIPARFESSRLPGKPLKNEINGKPMIEWTWQQAQRSGAERIIIATESLEVLRACEAFGAEVCLTGATHQSGTERIAEVIEKMGVQEDEIIVNVQGDEPMLPPELIHQVAEGLQSNLDIPMATLCEPIVHVETVFDPQRLKSVVILIISPLILAVRHCRGLVIPLALQKTFPKIGTINVILAYMHTAQGL